MPSKINNRRDVLLLLLYCPGATGKFNEPITGRTRIVKQLFLFKNEVLPHFRKGTSINSDNFYEFFPWNFGPFSSQVYDDLTFFQLRDYINSSASKEEALPEEIEEWDKWQSSLEVYSTSASDVDIDDFIEENFCLTEKGETWTKNELWNDLSESQKELLKQFKIRTTTVPLRALLRYVYKTYDDFTTKSTIKGDILGS